MIVRLVSEKVLFMLNKYCNDALRECQVTLIGCFIVVWRRLVVSGGIAIGATRDSVS
jgi:hypothetical protein